MSRPATQTALDPRRVGKQNSGFSDEDLADIICILIPSNSKARSEAYEVTRESSHHLLGGDGAGDEDGLVALEDDDDLGLASPRPDHRKYAIALRFSARVKEPLRGFTFGRNAARCDICFTNDPHRRLSNVHFRIFYNEYGTLMLEDQSTNGTIVDEALLRPDRGRSRVLINGTPVKVLSHDNLNDLKFIVRIPKRQGDSAAAWDRNFAEYMDELQALRAGANATITPGPQGPVCPSLPRRATCPY